MGALPEGIGPHEGREFDLMRRGEKDVALFFEIEPEGLAAILDAGFQFMKFLQFTHQGKEHFTHIVYRPSHKAQAIRLKKLVLAPKQGIDPVREHEIGAILGYTRSEVKAFIAHSNKLN